MNETIRHLKHSDTEQVWLDRDGEVFIWTDFQSVVLSPDFALSLLLFLRENEVTLSEAVEENIT